jgi:hypothetical protein
MRSIYGLAALLLLGTVHVANANHEFLSLHEPQLQRKLPYSLIKV